MSTKDITDKQICQIVHENNKKSKRTKKLIELLIELTGQPEKVCLRAAERCENHNYIEYGVSINYPWLTDKGKELLKD